MNGDIWIIKNGDKILISDMSDEHLINAMWFLIRKYKALYMEARKRGITNIEPDIPSYEDLVNEDCSLPGMFNGDR
jgi:ASC-1-like (ASCH) protein